MAACLCHTLSRLLSGQEIFLERVILVLHLLYETERLSMPLLHWTLGPSLSRYFNDWLILQVVLAGAWRRVAARGGAWWW